MVIMSERVRAWVYIANVQSVFKISIVCFSTHPDTSMHRACSFYRFTGLSFRRVATSIMVQNGAARVNQI